MWDVWTCVTACGNVLMSIGTSINFKKSTKDKHIKVNFKLEHGTRNENSFVASFAGSLTHTHIHDGY